MDCKFCGKSIVPKAGQKPSSVKRKKFCNHACAAAVNNRVHPKRKPEGQCDECGKPVARGRSWCSQGCKTAAAWKRKLESAAKNGIRVSRWRQSLKQRAVEYRGGKCIVCGYTRCVRALKFHHLDPTGKEFSISAAGFTRSWEKVKAELDKCVLVCGNHHDEIHEGLIDVNDFLVTGA